jgi:hypothetical protein
LVRAGIGALLVAGSPYFDTRRDRIITFAARQRLPALYPFREYAVAGGVLSYGVSITDGYRQVGLYTAKVPKGTRPADLPVHQVDKFELIINVKTAKALGIAVPQSALARRRGDRMSRRELIALLGGTATWPMTAWPQQPPRPVVGCTTPAQKTPFPSHTELLISLFEPDGEA